VRILLRSIGLRTDSTTLASVLRFEWIGLEGLPIR